MLIVIFVIKDRKLLDSKTISITVFVLGVEVIVSAYQLIVPTSLLSGLGTTLLVLGFFLIAENPDIDTAKEYALARDQADAANEAKSSFLAQMSHEIRTPLNAVMGMDEMILRESQDEEILEYAETIQKAGGTLLSLINDILIKVSKLDTKLP